MKTPLASHTRRFMFVVLAAIIPWAILLILFPRHTSVYWMWVMRDPHSAILVGAVYVGASTYYVLSMLHNDWPQTRMGLEGSFTVSLVLMLAAALHWTTIRPWHLMTLIWLPGYYAPLFFIPVLFRNEGERRSGAAPSEPTISHSWATWLTIRSFLYLAVAMVLFVFAEAFSRIWPWRIDPIEVRMFAAQPATFIWPAVAVFLSQLSWRRHRLPMFYVLALGIVQLVGLGVVSTAYEWSSFMGVLLPVVFAEWIVTPLLMLRRYGRVELQPSREAREATAPEGLAPTAVQYGVQIIGATYLAFGLLGFVPVDAINPPHPEGVGARYLLHFLAVNPMHNLVHLAIGISGLWAARHLGTAQRWGQAVGAVLLLLFVVGIWHAWTVGFPPDHSLLGLVSINSAGHVFHLATGVVALVLGLSRPRLSH